MFIRAQLGKSLVIVQSFLVVGESIKTIGFVEDGLFVVGVDSYRIFA